jgi:D-tagatose-1,6-bisphosphate aldolase subunit GatZ/KbaZ
MTSRLLAGRDQNDSINPARSIKREWGKDLAAGRQLLDLLSGFGQRGVTSVCSAHPWVIRAAADEARDHGSLLLIEATCNQVNQEGGYTGMRPRDFRDFVRGIAARAEISGKRLMLGGDHLGPHPWRKLPAEEAMDHAKTMIADYVRAGFIKIHLDASMPCAGDPAILPGGIIAARAAQLAEAAEAARAGGDPPYYIIGTEVPVPGGASHGLDALAVTTPDAAAETLNVHEQTFRKAGLADAWSRVVGLVVQPGVEFDNETVADYQPSKAEPLVRWRREKANDILFEAHSTDFQRPESYPALVEDGFMILKIGPGLTFAMREAICALAEIERATIAPEAQSRLMEIVEAVMRDSLGSWKDYYAGSDAQQTMLMWNSYSDRIRYYWPDRRIEAAMARLLSNLSTARLPEILLSRYLPAQYARVRAGLLPSRPEALILDKIRDALRPYTAACKAE